MAKGGRGGRRQTAPTQNPTQNPSPIPNSGGSGMIFAGFTDQEAQALRDEVDDMYEPSVRDAIKQYISKADTGNGYSMSQNFNNKLENDLKLNANEKFMDNYLQKGMHDIGKNIILYRGAHEDVLQKLGIKNYQNYTEQQLKQMVVGATFRNKGYTSASYDRSKNPFYTGANSGGREVEMVIKAPANTKAVFGAKSQAEFILNKNTQFRITNIRYTGRTATPRNAGMKPVVEIEVEIV